MGDGFQFVDIILFAMIAAFLVLRLRSVLGRHKDDGRPVPGADDTVVALPERPDRPARIDVAGAREPATPLDAGATQIKAVDPRFDMPEFIGGARAAFEMIVQAFADGDRKTLKQLLNAEVYENFEGAIADRETKNETLENTLIRIVSTDATEVEVEHDIASITVKIVSEQVNVTKSAAGELVEGNPNHIAEVTDIWTFSRDLRSRDPNWKLVATRSE